MNKQTLFIGLGIVVLVAGWYLFRPERLFISKNVDESFPSQTAATGSVAAAEMPVKLLEGQFHDVAHTGKGTATIYRLPDGQRVLRFADFETSNGPDVQVYLGKAVDASDNETVTEAGFYHVGALKGNVGDQNYDLPADLDLSQYRSVTIWCRRFQVNFATAPLMAQNS